MPLWAKPTEESTVREAVHPGTGLVGSSGEMKKLIQVIEKMAPVSATALIIGETGTGKELVARALHDLSERAEAPFVAINCGAISPELVESELFGHEKGAFTGAGSDRKGAFEQADGGTLFLDRQR
jgi:DNA-binding NtrC family response regulator